ncbi:MAG: M23 family metallopeptidase [Ignavibacteriae bacterium]|nr:M23 family metallopeptidase [Ignavibacteriota bacterium]
METTLGSYLWPTDASTKITSSFAEYRSTHFHGGIDISTNGVNGYKVFAVNDGYLYRIRITPNGYGKMLYVKHPDGYISTYAHLQTFNSDINRIAREEQYRRGTYEIDVMLELRQYPIKKGEVIAYTGETGFGPPHLHFEIRDADLNLVSPLLITKYTIEDNIPPAIYRIMVSPLSYNSTVDNQSNPVIIRLPRRKHDGLKLLNPIRIHGQIGLSIETKDRSGGSLSRAGIHRMEFYLDDSVAFAMQLNHVPVEKTKQISLHYDLPAIKEGRGKFQKLYLDWGNSLPFYENRPEGRGIIDTDRLKEGDHRFRILCKDITGNRTEVTGTIIVNHKPKFQLEHISEDEVILTTSDVESISKCFIYGKKLYAPQWSQHTLTKERLRIDTNKVTLPVNSKRYDVLQIITETKHGSRSSPRFHFLKKPPGEKARDVFIKTEIQQDYVRCTIASPGMFTETPVVTVQEGSFDRRIDIDAVDLYTYVRSFVPSETLNGHCIITVNAEVNGKPTSTQESLELYCIPANKSGSLALGNDGPIISYDSGAVYKALYMRIASERNRRSTIYTFEPQDVLLNKGITISLPSYTEEENHSLGLYFRSDGEWTLQTSQKDSATNTYSTTLTRTLGELALLRDNEQPTIGRLRVLPRGGNVYISFRYHDNLSGVDTDEIKMYLDGKLVIPEIDGEHHRVWYQADKPLAKGKHTLTITVKDRMKNVSTVTRTFSVK